MVSSFILKRCSRRDRPFYSQVLSQSRIAFALPAHRDTLARSILMSLLAVVHLCFFARSEGGRGRPSPIPAVEVNGEGEGGKVERIRRRKSKGIVRIPDTLSRIVHVLLYTRLELLYRRYNRCIYASSSKEYPSLSEIVPQVCRRA